MLFAGSSMTAASNSTPTRSNAPSGPSRSAARTICSPDPTAAPTRWATVCSLITTAKLNDVEPFAYLQDVLERMSDGHPDQPPRRPPALELAPSNRAPLNSRVKKWTLTAMKAQYQGICTREQVRQVSVGAAWLE